LGFKKYAAFPLFLSQYPNDPQVAFEAAFKKDASPEERHQWQEALKGSDPGNSLLNYLLALDYFKSCYLPLRHVQVTKTLARRAGPIFSFVDEFL